MANNVIKFGEKETKGFLEFLSAQNKIEIELDSEDVTDVQATQAVVTTFVQYLGALLGKNKEEGETTEVEIPDLLTFRVSHREGGEESDGSWNVEIVAGPEFKKYVKDDERLESIND